jgi:hypothetical protein
VPHAFGLSLQAAAELQKVFRLIVMATTVHAVLNSIGSAQHPVLHRSSDAMTESRRQLQPASLKWQEDGELAAQDVFNLVCRLRAVESGETSNELWRLAQKYPAPTSRPRYA